MEELYRSKTYSPEIRAAIKKLPPLATEIANRWMLGWPGAVKALLESGEYLAALKEQERQERKVLAEPGNSHLARHEIAQEYGLSLAPPTTM